MELELAQPAAEGRVVRRRNLLIADNHHVVIKQSLVNGLKLLVIVRPREIRAYDLGAQGGRNRPDLNRHGAVLNFRDAPQVLRAVGRQS